MFYAKNKVVSNHQLYNFSYKIFHFLNEAYVLFFSFIYFSNFALNYLKPLQLGSLEGYLVYLIKILSISLYREQQT